MSIEDKAQEHEAELWEARNAPRPPARTFKPDEEGYGPADCGDCGDQMAPSRRADGLALCVPCKSIRERLAARFARR